jgi:hypothetical protein
VLAVPEMSELNLDSFEAQLKTDLTTAMDDVKQIDNKITDAINEAAAIPLTDERFTEASLTVWPFINQVIPSGAFSPGAVRGPDLEDFSIHAKKFNDNRHRLY